MKRKQLIRLKKIATLTGIILIIGFFLYIYFKTNAVTITSYQFEYTPKKPDTVSELALLSVMQELENKPLFYIFPANKILSFHIEEARNAIKELLPNVRNVDISPRGLHTLHLSIHFYTPLFKVGNTDAITQDSIVYKEPNIYDGMPTLTFGTSTIPTASELTIIAKLVSQVKTILFPVESIVIDEYRDIYLYDSTKKHKVIFSSQSDIDTIWSTMISAIDTEPLKTKLQNNKESLEYIDARYANKVFYKFTNTASTTIIQGNNATTSFSTTTTR